MTLFFKYSKFYKIIYRTLSLILTLNCWDICVLMDCLKVVQSVVDCPAEEGLALCKAFVLTVALLIAEFFFGIFNRSY